MTSDRKLIADVLEHDRKATGMIMEGCADSFLDAPRALRINEECRAMRNAAPELAGRLAALLDALDEVSGAPGGNPVIGRQTVGVVEAVRAAYARSLAERSKP